LIKKSNIFHSCCVFCFCNRSEWCLQYIGSL